MWIAKKHIHVCLLAKSLYYKENICTTIKNEGSR